MLSTIPKIHYRVRKTRAMMPRPEPVHQCSHKISVTVTLIFCIILHHALGQMTH